MQLSKIEQRAIVAKFIDKVKPKVEKVIGRTYKEILAENKVLKEENERLKKKLEEKDS